jgi:hypothetical protein
MAKQSKWEDITDILTEDGAEKIQVGQVLIFDYEGSPVHLKVVRKRFGKVWAKKMHLYTQEEYDAIKRVDNIVTS